MGWDGQERRADERRGIACSPDTCQYHVLTESVIGDLKDAVQKLMEGQEQMSHTVIQLAESFKSVDRLDRRLEKIEDAQNAKEEKQDGKIDELRGFMYKVMGISIGGISVVSIAIQVIVVLL